MSIHIRILARLNKVVAFSEDDFNSWDKKTQQEWLKLHPDSKFGKQTKKSSKPAAPKPIEAPDLSPVKLSKEEKLKQAQQKWEEQISAKSEEDQKVFREAKKDGVAIPPVWTNVTYNKKPIEGVIASGTDAKGRKQRLEDPEYRNAKIREKHARIQETLEPIFDSVVRKLRKEAATSPEAQVLYLITQTGFRIGGEGDGKARAKAYGASTLLGKHVSIDGDKVTFDFIGKEGVRQLHTIKDATVAKFCSGKEPEDKLFNTNEEKIRKVWKTFGGEKVHDIRSLLATRIARKKLKELIPPEPKTLKEVNGVIKAVSEEASKRLGNRPSEALNTYIDQSILPKVSA